MDEFSAVLGTEFHFTRGTSELKNSSAVFESQAPMAQRSPCALFVQVDHLPYTVLGPLGGIVKKKKRDASVIRIVMTNLAEQFLGLPWWSSG